MKITALEFTETAPLYTRVEVKDFAPPGSITRMCSRCKRDTTWAKFDAKDHQLDTTPNVSFQSMGYSCVLCRDNSIVVLYEKLEWKEDPSSTWSPKSWSHFAVRKVGQIPQQEIDIPAELNTRLGATASHYKKALICRSQNYGIGAMSYLRRVVDEKTDELIDVMADLARTYQVEEAEVEELLKAKKQVRYEDKMRVAAELLPAALRPGGVNPLGQLYDHTSIGLHGKTDDECVAIFDDLRGDFEYVFRNLHLQAEERRQFAKRVQARATKPRYS